MNRKREIRDINKELINKCKEGSSKAQFEVYRLYFMAMFNASFRIVNDSQEAEDIMQESFLKAFQNLDQYKGDVSFGSWLKKIVINQSLDHLRKQKLLFDTLESLNNDSYSTDQEDEYTEDETLFEVGKIRNEIGNLPQGYRIVLSLYLLEGYDHDEIAEILGISSSTSRSQFARARKRLLENLKKK